MAVLENLIYIFFLAFLNMNCLYTIPHNFSSVILLKTYAVGTYLLCLGELNPINTKTHFLYKK